MYVYCTLKEPYLHYGNGFFSGSFNGLVMGEFTCKRVIHETAPWRDKSRGTCLTDRDLAWYANGKDLFFMEIDNPVTYLKPKELKEFGIIRPPQSFQFVKELEDV